MRYILLVLLLLINTRSLAEKKSPPDPQVGPHSGAAKQSCSLSPTRHPIYCKIDSLNPTLSHEWKLLLSDEIHRALRESPTIDVNILLAIGMQENSLRPGYRLNERGEITDVGPFQIHVRTAQYYRLDIYRLVTDLSYQIGSAIHILKDKQRACQHLGKERSWACYHSFTPPLRESYERLVRRYLPREEAHLVQD